MTTPAHSELAYTLTRHYFGETIGRIVRSLFNYDQASLRVLKSDLPDIKLNDLRKSLLILVKYQLVDYVKTVKNFSHQYEYSVVPKRVYSFFRLSRYIQCYNLKKGRIARDLLTSTTKNALTSREKLIELTLNAYKQDQNTVDEVEIKSQIAANLDKLILDRYIVQTGNSLNLNIDRFNKDSRNDLLVHTLLCYYGQEQRIKALCQAILELTHDTTADDAPITAPISLSDLISLLVPNEFKDKQQLEGYLAKLVSESNHRFFVNSGLHPNKGPLYGINVGLVMDHMVKEHLSSLITSRFGPKCCRVFRVLLLRGPLLLQQIEEFIMLPARDVREYSYMLMKEGFIRNRQVPKTPDNAPGKSVFIMSVELDQVVYSAADLCCRSMNNLLVRYDHELKRNKVLLDRAKAVRDLLKTSGCATEPSQDDWNQYFNSHEMAQLEQVNRNLNKLLLAKNQVDETLSLFHCWIELRPNLEVEETH